MKILKITGLSILALLLLITIAGLMLPSKIQVERSLVIKASPEAIYNQIDTLKNWESWSPWHKMDPSMILTYAGPEAGNGASYAWVSEKMGNGKLTITKTQPYKQITTELELMEGNPAIGTYYLEETDKGTKITWSMVSDMGTNPYWCLMGVMMDKMLGDDFEKGLESLRAIVENQPEDKTRS